MRWLGAAAVMLMVAPVAAQDTGCPPASEVLAWTAELLDDIRAGDAAAAEMRAGLLLEATNRADEGTRAAAWPDRYLGTLDELGYLTSAIARGDVRPARSELDAIVGYAGALNAITAERCGSGGLPTFVAAPPGDAAACSRVIHALTQLKQVLPAMQAKTGPFAATLLFAASVSIDGAAGEADAGGWSEDTVALLAKISGHVRSVSEGDAAPSQSMAIATVSIGRIIADEARAICIGQEIPTLAVAG